MDTDNLNKEFEFKLDLLKQELSRIDVIIDKFDNISQSAKYWTILIFLGLITAILGSEKSDINNLIVLTPLVPIFFWILDTLWRRHQNRAIFRSRKITDYLNSDTFSKAFISKKLANFKVWDTMGICYSDDPDYKKFTSFWRIFWFRTVSRYYMGLILIGLLLVTLVLTDIL